MRSEPFNPREELKLLDAYPAAAGTQGHLLRIQLGLMAEANDLQQNRNALLDRLDDKLGVIAVQLEQISDTVRSQ